MQRNTGAGIPLADAEQYRVLVEAITDYAVYMLDPTRDCHQLEPRSAKIQGLQGVGNNWAEFLTILYTGGQGSWLAAEGARHRCQQGQV